MTDPDRMTASATFAADAQFTVTDQHRDPMAGHGRQPERLVHPGDVPGADAQRPQRREQLGVGRRVVEIAAQGVVDALLIEPVARGAALRTGRVEPDLHALTLGGSAVDAVRPAAAPRSCLR